MQSGQGGIRYNDSLKQIQLMDENKNWVKYKSYDVYAQFKGIFYTQANVDNGSYEFEYNGLYLLIYGADSGGLTSIRYTDAAATRLYGETQWGLIAITASAGNWMYYTFNKGTYGGAIACYFIGSGFSNISVLSYTKFTANNQSYTNTIDSELDRIIIGLGAGGGSPRAEASSSVSDFINYTTSACCCSTREAGTSSIKITSGSSGGGSSTIAKLAVS